MPNSRSGAEPKSATTTGKETKCAKRRCREDFDPRYYVEVEVDVEDDCSRDDYVDYGKGRGRYDDHNGGHDSHKTARSDGYKDDFSAAYGIQYNTSPSTLA